MVVILKHLYKNLPNTYDRVAFTVIDERCQEKNNIHALRFDDTFIGTSVSSSVMYAVSELPLTESQWLLLNSSPDLAW